ncbi:MAG: hypothetical protein IPG21_18795 [Saprospiraceae bacterium]|nr:hypothetical protein [Candidatus Vicinibacter affinis]
MGDLFGQQGRSLVLVVGGEDGRERGEFGGVFSALHRIRFIHGSRGSRGGRGKTTVSGAPNCIWTRCLFPSQLGRLLRNLALCAALPSNDAVEPKTVEWNELGVCQKLPQPQQTSGAGGDDSSQQSVRSTVEWRLATRMEM